MTDGKNKTKSSKKTAKHKTVKASHKAKAKAKTKPKIKHKHKKPKPKKKGIVQGLLDKIFIDEWLAVNFYALIKAGGVWDALVVALGFMFISLVFSFYPQIDLLTLYGYSRGSLTSNDSFTHHLRYLILQIF